MHFTSPGTPLFPFDLFVFCKSDFLAPVARFFCSLASSPSLREQQRMYLIISTSLEESNLNFLLKELKLLLEHHKAFTTLPLVVPIFLLTPILCHALRCATRNLCETTFIMHFFIPARSLHAPAHHLHCCGTGTPFNSAAVITSLRKSQLSTETQPNPFSIFVSRGVTQFFFFFRE